MAHIQQLTYISLVKDHFIHDSRDLKILEIGSYDFNGTIRKFFPDSEYTGVDLCEGPGVDLVGFGHEVSMPDESVDISISCECFEHDANWIATINNMHRMTKPGGLVVITCATLGRIEHGTRRSSLEFSPGTQAVGLDYYKNLGQADFEKSLNLQNMFQHWRFFTMPTSFDLYFIGWKKGETLFSGNENLFEQHVNDIKKLKRFRMKAFDLPVSVARILFQESTFQDFACYYYKTISPVRKFFKSLGKLLRN